MKVGGRSFERKVVLIKRCVRGRDAVQGAPTAPPFSRLATWSVVIVVKSYDNTIDSWRRAVGPESIAHGSHPSPGEVRSRRKVLRIFHVLAFLIESRSG